MATAQEELRRLQSRYGIQSPRDLRFEPQPAVAESTRRPEAEPARTAQMELLRLRSRYMAAEAPLTAVEGMAAITRVPDIQQITGQPESLLSVPAAAEGVEMPGTVRRTARDIQVLSRQTNDLVRKAVDATGLPREHVLSLIPRAASGFATGMAGFVLGDVPEMMLDLGLHDPRQYPEIAEDVTEYIASGQVSPRLERMGEFVTGVRELVGSALITADNVTRKIIAGSKNPYAESAYNIFVNRVGNPVAELILGREITKEEYDRVIDQAVENPEQPIFGTLILTGAIKTGVRAGRRVGRARPEVPSAREPTGPSIFEQIEHEEALVEFTERGRRTRVAERSREALREQRQIEEARREARRRFQVFAEREAELRETGEIVRDHVQEIRGLSDARLNDELVDLGLEPEVIARTSRNQREYIASGGRIPLTEPFEEVIPRAEEVTRDRGGRYRERPQARPEGRERAGRPVEERVEPVGGRAEGVPEREAPKEEAPQVAPVEVAGEKVGKKVPAKEEAPAPAAPEKIVTRLRDIADRMQKQIDNKLSPAIGQQRPTARRARIAAGMYEEGRILAQIQQEMRGVADAMEAGTLPEILTGIKTRLDVETIRRWDHMPKPGKHGFTSDRERLIRMGIETDSQAKTAREALFDLVKEKPAEVSKESAIQKQYRELRFRKEKGFFVTPEPVAKDLVKRADIRPGESVLEPSAGLGDLADQLPKDQTKVIELSHERRDLLRMKGHDVLPESDFLEYHGKHDKIVMNPPFEQGQDIIHVQHAYELLNPGGKVVSIMGEGAFFRQDKKATAFREWFEEVGGTSEQLPAGAFKMAGTGVTARIVEITKPGEAKKPLVEKPPAPAEVAETAKEAVKEIIEGKRESNLGNREFKKLMEEKISEELKDAPDEPDPVRSARLRAAEAEKEWSEATHSLRKEFKLGEALDEAKKRLDGAAKEAGIEKVTIHIPGDGDFTVYKTKQVLRDLQDKLRRMIPESKEEALGALRKPIAERGEPHVSKFTIEADLPVGGPGPGLIPVPRSPRRAKEPGRIEIEGESKYVTNGHYALDASLLKGELGIDPTQGARTAKASALNEIVQEAFADKKAVPADEAGRLKDDVLTQALFTDGKKIVPFNAKYVDWLHKTVSDFNLLVNFKQPEKAAVVRSGNKKVGLLMPLRADKLPTMKVVSVEGLPKAKPVKAPTPKHPTQTDRLIFEPEEPTKPSGKPSAAADAYVAQLDPRDAGDFPTKTTMDKIMPGEPTEAAVKPRDVLEHASRAFNIPIRRGRVRAALGMYFHGWDIARVKDLKDIGVAMHEVAHAIDAKHGLRESLFAPYKTEKGYLRHHKKQPAWVKELRDIDYYQGKRGRRLYEGYAEYMRHLITEAENVEVIAPEFTKLFSDWLDKHPDVKQSVGELRAMVRKWREQGAASRVYAQIDVKGKGIRLPVGERLARAKRKFMVRFVDDVHMMEYAEKQLRGITNIDPTRIDPATSPSMIARAVSKTAWRKAYEMVTTGTFDFAGNPTGISLRAALEPVAGQLKDWLTYAYAKRAVELHKRGINPGVDMGDAAYVVKTVEPSNVGPTFRRALEETVRWNDRVLQYAVEAGALSAEAAMKMRALNEWFIPLKRVMDNDPSWASTGGNRLADLPSVTKRIRGSGRQIRHPLDAMIENAANIISISDKTRVGKALVSLARGQAGKGMKVKPEGLDIEAVGRWVFPVSQPKQMIRLQVQRILEELHKRGYIEEMPEEVMDSMGDPATITFFINQHRYFGKDNIVSFWEGGKRHFYEIDAELYQAIKGIDQFFLPPVLDWLFGKPARAVRLGATGLNPEFTLITNPSRDALTYGLQSEYIKGAGAPLAYVRSMMSQTGLGSESMKNMRQMFRRSGADMSTFIGGDRRSIKKLRDEATHHKAYNIVNHPIEVARDLLSVTEIIPRMAEYEAAYKKGAKLYGEGSAGAQIMAANAASEVTVNFRRMGVYGRMLNQMIPFWNAQVQGAFRFARFAREHPMLALTKALSSVTMPTIAMWMYHRDEDWYQNLPDWQKYNYWLFRVGTESDGSPRILRVPRPFEWGIVFGSLPEATLNYWYQRDRQRLEGAFEHFGEQVLPGMMPVLPRLWYEYQANYNFFTDRSIDPDWEVEYTKHAPQARFSPWTTETAKFIGKQFGMSPRRIEHVLRGATGGLGLSLVRGFENMIGPPPTKEEPETAKDFPVIGRAFARVPPPEELDRQLDFEARTIKAEVRRLVRQAKETGDDWFRQKAESVKENWNQQHPEKKIYVFIPRGK